MASFGHLAVGLVAARHSHTGPVVSRQIRVKHAALLCSLSMLPDADVITFLLGIPYEAPLGHRGAGHSLSAGIAMALVLTPLLNKILCLSFRRTFGLALLCILSHGILDTLTDGGLGIALGWPFSNERFFAPFRPIPVSPIGRAFLSPSGLRVFTTEVLYFMPLLCYGLWPRKPVSTTPDR